MLRLPYFADPANLEVVEDEPKKIEDGPEGETSLQLLQAVYRDRKQPLRLRISCADKCLKHEYPQISAVGVMSISGQESFAEALDRCIARSQGPVLFNAAPPELPAEELKRPFSNYRNNFRRY